MSNLGLGREGQDAVGFDAEFGGERGERLAELVVGDTVGLGGDDEVGAVVVTQPLV